MQSMQATSIGNNAVQAKTERNRSSAESEAFDSLLVGVQSAQMESVVVVFADATGLKARSNDRAVSARRSRVDAETATARQEAAAHCARRTDATVPDRGVELARQERHRADRRAAPESTTPGSRTGATGTQIASPSPPAIEGVAVPDGKAQSAEAAFGRAPKDAGVSSPASQAGAPAPPVEEAAAQAPAASARAVRVQQASPGADKVAELVSRSLGRLLAGRGTIEAVRAPAATQADALGRANESPSTARSAKAPAGGDSPSGRTDKTDSPSSTRRTEFQHLVTRIRLNSGVRASSATMHLDPPDLGRMRIDVRMVDDTLQLRVEAATPEARRTLRFRAGELVAALREHHIEVERFEIVAAPAREGGEADEGGGGETGRGAQAHGGDTPQDAPGGTRRDDGDMHPEQSGGEAEEQHTSEPTATHDARLDVRV